MSANTGSAREIKRAQGLSEQVLDLARRGLRDRDDIRCLNLVLQALKNGHLHEVRVTPRLSEEELARRGETRINHLINCDAPLHLSYGYVIRPEDQIASRVRGRIQFDSNNVRLHLAENQQTGVIEGIRLKEQLEGQPVLSANVLNYLLAHTALIPNSWKRDEAGNTRHIYFWGTIYHGLGGDLCVRCLFWTGGRWDWNYNYLAGEFGDRGPAALLASPV